MKTTMKPYQFAILRYRHDVASGEFVNIGIVLWVASERAVHAKLNRKVGRLKKFFGTFDGDLYQDVIDTLAARIRHLQTELAEEQTKLYAVRPRSIKELMDSLIREDATVLQWSEVMAGAFPEPALRADQLFDELVTGATPGRRARRDDRVVLASLTEKLTKLGLDAQIDRDVELHAAHYDHTFKRAWKNGKLHVLEPISFDYAKPADIFDKANTWSGRLFHLQDAQPFTLTGVVAKPSGDAELQRAYETALAMLSDAPNVRQLVVEEDFEAEVGPWLVEQLRGLHS